MESWKKIAFAAVTGILIVNIAPKAYRDFKSSEPRPIGEYFYVLTSEGKKPCIQYGEKSVEFSCLSNDEKLPLECFFDQSQSPKCLALKKLKSEQGNTKN